MNIKRLELSEGTLRQRRNLFVLSVIIIFIEYAKITFEPTIKIQGISAIIHNPEVIYTFINISLVYFLWRYYQYFSVDGAYAHMKNQHQTMLINKQDAEILKIIRKKHPKLISMIGKFSYQELETINNKYKAVVSSAVDIDPIKGTDTKLIEVTFSKLKVEYLRLPVFINFIFKEKIITDYYIPFILAFYAMYIKNV